MSDKQPIDLNEAPTVSPTYAFTALKLAIHNDPEYAWGWHCNLAMPICDALGVRHEQGNIAAAHLMSYLFDYDVTKDERYQYIKSDAQLDHEFRVSIDEEETGVQKKPLTMAFSGFGMLRDRFVNKTEHQSVSIAGMDVVVDSDIPDNQIHIRHPDGKTDKISYKGTMDNLKRIAELETALDIQLAAWRNLLNHSVLPTEYDEGTSTLIDNIVNVLKETDDENNT